MNKKEEFFIKETQEHVDNVRYFIKTICTRLKARGVLHDYSKFRDPEKEIFIEMTPKLKKSTYPSPEYDSFLKEMKVALDHHYAHNRHHPEFFSKGIEDMNIIDLIELLCDWKSATLRHKKGDLKNSIDEGEKRFGLSPQLAQIFKNSIELFESNGDKLSGMNITKPVIEVNHKDLERCGNSLFKSTCPVCEEGLLLVGRDQDTFILQEYDHCILCGQHYKYMDIQELRKAEGNENGINN